MQLGGVIDVMHRGWLWKRKPRGVALANPRSRIDIMFVDGPWPSGVHTEVDSRYHLAWHTEARLAQCDSCGFACSRIVVNLVARPAKLVRSSAQLMRFRQAVVDLFF